MSKIDLDKAGKNGLKGPQEVCVHTVIWTLQKLADEMLNVIDEMEKLDDEKTRAEPDKVSSGK